VSYVPTGRSSGTSLEVPLPSSPNLGNPALDLVETDMADVSPGAAPVKLVAVVATVEPDPGIAAGY
jgi:hypothetical protein